MGGEGSAADDNGIDSGSGGASVSEELKDIKSTMSEMMCMLKDMQGIMNGMQKEITKLTKKCDGMEKVQNDIKGNRETLDLIKHKQKYQEILLQNQKWEYSAERPSEEYWTSLEEDGEHEAYRARTFLTEIRKCTEQMRYGFPSMRYGSNSDGSVRLLATASYHLELRPHWIEFANALNQHQYRLNCLSEDDNVSELHLFHMELSRPILDLLSEALKSTFFKRFALYDNNFGQEGIDFALDYLENNDRLIQFSIIDNPVNKVNLLRLCRIIRTHPSLKKLTLSEAKGDDVEGYDTPRLIMESGRNKLKYLDLSINDIWDNSVTGVDSSPFIEKFLSSNPSLEILNLSENYDMGDETGEAIAAALKYNTNLRGLVIANTGMTTFGWQALSKAVFDKTSLNSAADSNHTCMIEFPEEDDDFDEVRYINGHKDPNSEPQFNPNPIYVRQRKIYSILSAWNRSMSNVDHFGDDMPVELLPDMLTSVQKYFNYYDQEDIPDTPPRDTQDVMPLSIVFEILQRWDKSLAVFEALSS